MKKIIQRLEEKLDPILDARLTHLLTFPLMIALIYFFLGQALNPFDQQMFNFHDETQAGRIHDFALNIENGIIPPRIAPNFSFNLGLPVFNFYSPTAYWISSLIHMSGIDIITSLKLSFLLTILLSYVTMYVFLKRFFAFYPSLLGGIIYSSSIYFAIEIFIRGNLAEAWFLVLFPLGLYMLIANSYSHSRFTFAFSAVIISLLFTTHNVLSPLSFALFVVTLFLLPNKKRSLLVIFSSILLASYFLIPAILEVPWTKATEIAKQFDYKDHFLCLRQIWNSPWNFGGSLAGCEADLMSFKLGKIHITLGLLGIVAFLYDFLFRKKRNLLFLGILFLTIGSIFMTTYYSQFVWRIFESILSLFQFPWRFLVFGMFGAAFFSAYLFETIKIPFKYFLVLLIGIVCLYTGTKYFTKPLMTYEEYYQGYLSPIYLHQFVAYNIREYVPHGIDYQYWHYLNPLEVNRQLLDFDYKLPIESKAEYTVVKNNAFEKEVSIYEPTTVVLNIHYFPFWEIQINNTVAIPTEFDRLYRPVIRLTEQSNITIRYKETTVETISNTITLTTFIILMIYTLNSKKIIQSIAYKLQKK